MSTSDNVKNQLILNRLNKTQYDEATISNDEFYFVDPEFKGNKILVTDANGQITEANAGIADIPAVINNTVSTSTTDALSANMGKEMQDEINNLKARGRFLALWNCATGLPATNPVENPYPYKAGDYYIVGTVAASGGTNYEPTGSSYTTGTASTVIETAEVAIDDVYYYDGTTWKLQANTQKTVSFANIAGQPTDNSNLATALNAKVDDVQISSTSIVTDGVAVIPNASNDTYGVTKLTNSLVSTSNTIALAASSINNFYRDVITGVSTYDKNSTYAVGDKVRSTSGYYECITAITTPHTWDASEWQQITIQGQIDEKSEQTSFVDWID